MERLTRNNRGFFELCEDTRTCNKICEENEECTDECVIQKAINKLGEYEDLDEQLLLAKFPCKVGDTVYRPVPNLYRTYTESVVKEINITDGGIYFKTDKGISWKIDKIGKTVFLTRQEAEQVLKKMESEE